MCNAFIFSWIILSVPGTAFHQTISNQCLYKFVTPAGQRQVKLVVEWTVRGYATVYFTCYETV